MKNKCIIIDPSSKVDRYDDALYNALRSSVSVLDYKLMYSGHGLLKLIPAKFESSGSIIKRLLKSVECVLNYVYIIIYTIIKRPQILHFQWLPFLEICSIENELLKVLKFFNPSIRLLLTIHNIYPHNSGEIQRNGYKKRFIEVSKQFDSFIVHTETSKSHVCEEFRLDSKRVFVCCHGVFEPEGVSLYKKQFDNNCIKILQFGGQSYYKGTDILVKAISSLPNCYQERLEVKIVGGIKDSFLSELQKIDEQNTIEWKPYFLSNEELYSDINNSDIIVLPYRAISQSGVLLLSIYFEKIILLSDLPSFKDTIQCSYDKELESSVFFKSENPEQLQKLLCKYIDGQIDLDRIYSKVRQLKEKYSWTNAAFSTIEVYNGLINRPKKCYL